MTLFSDDDWVDGVRRWLWMGRVGQAHSRALFAVAISISRVSNCVRRCGDGVVVAVGEGDDAPPPPTVRRLPKDAAESTLGLWGTRTHTDGTGAK